MRTAVVAACLVVVVAVAASVPAASAYGCFDDCYERCANGKQDPACTNMCKEACGSAGAVGAAGAGAVAAGAGAMAAGAEAVAAGASTAGAAFKAAPGAAGKP